MKNSSLIDIERGKEVYGLTAPEQKCSQCGAKNWNYQMLPGQARFRETLFSISGKLWQTSFVAFFVMMGCFYFQKTEHWGFIMMGTVPIFALSGLLVDWIAGKTVTRLSTCKDCGHKEII